MGYDWKKSGLNDMEMRSLSSALESSSNTKGIREWIRVFRRKETLTNVIDGVNEGTSSENSSDSSSDDKSAESKAKYVCASEAGAQFLFALASAYVPYCITNS